MKGTEAFGGYLKQLASHFSIVSDTRFLQNFGFLLCETVEWQDPKVTFKNAL